MTDIVKLYNPANAAALTSEDLAGLQKLSSAEIKELAQAYPNMTMQRAYLLIVDGSKPVDKQLPTLSTFENLLNLWEKNNMKNYVPFGFRGNYHAKATPLKVKRQEVLDLSDTELMTLPGFKTANKGVIVEKETQPQQVKVTKINKPKLTAKPKSKTKSK